MIFKLIFCQIFFPNKELNKFFSRTKKLATILYYTRLQKFVLQLQYMGAEKRYWTSKYNALSAREAFVVLVKRLVVPVKRQAVAVKHLVLMIQ